MMKNTLNIGLELRYLRTSRTQRFEISQGVRTHLMHLVWVRPWSSLCFYSILFINPDSIYTALVYFINPASISGKNYFLIDQISVDTDHYFRHPNFYLHKELV